MGETSRGETNRTGMHEHEWANECAEHIALDAFGFDIQQTLDALEHDVCFLRIPLMEA